MKFIPHEYQKIAIRHILEHPAAALLLDMGLGKTVTTLTAIAEMMTAGIIQKALVIAPLRVAKNTWPAEIRKWDHLRGLSCRIAVGNEKERREAFSQPANLTIINRENEPWLYQQMNARLYRQGQNAETVVIMHIVTKDTMDERVLRALEAKDRVQEALIEAVKAEVIAE